MSLGWGYTKSFGWEQIQVCRVRTQGGEQGAGHAFSANKAVVVLYLVIVFSCCYLFSKDIHTDNTVPNTSPTAQSQ